MPVRPDLDDRAELFAHKSPLMAARIKLKTGEQSVHLRVEERERAVNRSVRTRNPEAPKILCVPSDFQSAASARRLA